VVHLSDNDIRFRTSSGVTVFVDPMAAATDLQVRRARMSRPDLILITHPHLDHFNVVVLLDYAKRNRRLVVAGPADVVRYARVDGVDVTEVAPGTSYTLAGVAFRTVPAYYLDGSDHPRASGWVGYVLRLDGVTYYVTGDTQPLPEMAEIRPDVLLPPVEGCGSNIDQALTMVRMCAPRVVVPVHTGGEDDVVNEFLARLPPGVQGACYKDGKLRIGRGPAAR
jgi:L-ascorbate metabolism protein UlaG (beta-lactamase superfamily)